ncbi:hypothetical protein [Psychrobacter sp. FDAARGOS_221]|uniref:hypothetical protein n=1 Tax=Psychrobacter sp. FDAARGOS_221 TaxID=1975705 RepID=UPI000BB54D56|nr:hypothetical protein [Psychrobacter sp. FDAARGOS_221]PNK59478.1 hypothetical protein A6J60_000285 [Psychrobacter sp. FDAARGOS_221]PNK59908.1 hypothetical protein A6J60_002785 [Psychrobacter sp. FDAARGOS_221]PNK61454.1 hypothetical protein A6J60_011660 [Psychrobacter sp. FDAARGOS_221]
MQGLQVWDEKGKKVLDTSFTTFKILKEVQGINQSEITRTVSFTHPLLAEQTPFYMIKPLMVLSSVGVSVNVQFESTKCTVTFTALNYRYRDFSKTKVIIGVY